MFSSYTIGSKAKWLYLCDGLSKFVKIVNQVIVNESMVSSVVSSVY